MHIHAIQIGKSIDTKKLAKQKGFKVVAKNPQVYELAKNQWFTVFNYGVVVFWNIEAPIAAALLKKFSALIKETSEEQNFETFGVTIKKGSKIKIEEGELITPKLDLGLIQLISVMLSRSVILESLEKETDANFSGFSSVTKIFNKTGRINARSSTLLKLVGSSMKIKHDSIYKLSVLDKPEFTWEDAELNALYSQLEDELEIAGRYKNLREKIETMIHDSEFILNYIESRRALILEAIIVALILFEVIMFFFDK